MEHTPLQWHAAFQAAIQIELEADQESLQFINEFSLTKMPLKIDIMIIKLLSSGQLKAGIGKLFRKHNLVEYKGHGDYFSINDFYKVTAYACLYQSDTEHVLEIDPDEITLTMVCDYFPRNLANHLKTRYNAEITEPEPGIYYVAGTMFPLQIVVIRQLSKENYVWLGRLRTDLTIEADISALNHAYHENKNSPNYRAIMDLIVRANQKTYEEVNVMCDALRELLADDIEAAGHKRIIKQICRKLSRGKSMEAISEEIEESINYTRTICVIAEKYAPEYNVDLICKEFMKQSKQSA